ncbi:MAG: hypothetical protein Q4A19_06905 [Johnsonella sp.]|nr:hypothetical protein [Johnsonella sp.]
MSASLKKTIFGMGFGIVLYELALSVLLLFLAPGLGYSRLSLAFGVILGTICAFAMLIHMGIVLEDVLASRDPEYARKKTISHNMIRKLLLLAVVAACWNIRQINVLALILAVFGIKPGAYLQPFADRIFFGNKKIS